MRLIHRWLLLSALLGLLAMTSISAGSAPFQPPGLARAIQVQEAHTDALMAKAGVVGTAVGVGANGRAVVMVFTESPGVAGIPNDLEGVAVVPHVTGEISAFPKARG